MTEKIQRLVMHAFRGVPGEMTVDFGKGESLAVYGDNGTGKSTIADALEWYFTGEIEFLRHEGRQHAVRHVGGDDSRRDRRSRSSRTARSAGRSYSPTSEIPTRSRTSGRRRFSFADARWRTSSTRPRRRSGRRWSRYSAWTPSRVFGRTCNGRETIFARSPKPRKNRSSRCGGPWRPGNEPVTHETVLANLQQICQMLGVDPPRLSGSGSRSLLAHQCAVGASAGSVGSLRPREPSGRNQDAQHAGRSTQASLEGWNALVSSRRAQLLPRASLVREAKRLVEAQSIDGRCPLCGQKVNEKELAQKIETALVEVLEASRELERCAIRSPSGWMNWARPTTNGLRSHDSRARQSARPAAASRVHSRGTSGERRLARRPWTSRRSRAICPSSGSGTRRRARWARRRPPPAPARAIRSSSCWPRSASRSRRGARLKRKPPERCARSRWRTASSTPIRRSRRKTWPSCSKRISHRVAQIYSALHPGENLAESVSIEPWTAKGVELAVEFYGSRQRPPHGVLSESHLNSLAIALFLAMAEEFNTQLGFLLLDDVINSFDVEHRGRLAELLADGFTDWQIIVLTHDQQFFEHLSRRAPSWRKLELTSWSYDSGPRTTRYETSGILAAARERLGSGDVHGAAAKARRGARGAPAGNVRSVVGAAPLPARPGERQAGTRGAVQRGAAHAQGAIEGRSWSPWSRCSRIWRRTSARR